jgi:hypothetical protein
MVTLPSKKVLSLIILTAALVISIMIVFGRDKSSQAINLASNLVVGDKASIPENPNWQNELSGISYNSTSTQTEASTSAPETVTDTVSRTLLSDYLALSQSGNLSSSSAQALIDKTIEYMDQTQTVSPAIQASELNVVADNGKQSVMDYGENFGMILKTNKPAEPKEVSSVVTQIIQSGDVSKIKELDGIIIVYNKVVLELTKMPVPKTFVKAHLDVINSIRSGASALTEIEIVSNDPVKALAALKTYGKSVNMFTQVMQAIYGFIAQNNVVYKQGSGGYYLLHGI